MRHLRFLVALVCCFLLANCNNLDEVNDRLDNLEENVSQLQKALQELQRAAESRKIVSSVVPFQTEEGGWIITFSDNTSITLRNGQNGKDGKDGQDGQNGIAPVIRINPSNFHWEMSVDSGITWTDLGVVAKGQDGKNGEDGEDGQDGQDGQNGKDGISPLIQINKETLHWEISFDQGESWIDTGIMALGQNGRDGEDGQDGEDGEDGKDAIPPMLRVNSDTTEWEISYDGGITWLPTGQPSRGEDGKDGVSPLVRINSDTLEWEISNDDGLTWVSSGVVAKGIDGTNGDAFFKNISFGNGFVIFELLDGSTFMFQMADDTIEPKLLSMEFRETTNPTQLINTTMAQIEGDSVVHCWIDYLLDDKQLIPHFTYDGDSVMADDTLLISDVTRHDFRRPVHLSVKSGTLTKDYTVYVHAFTGLPVLWIETENRTEITSKEEYLNARFRLREDVVTRAPGEVLETDGYIKGRGNSSWGFPKKAYRLKFDEKISFIDEPKDKSWILVPNYTDKTMLRNAIACYIGDLSNLDYTPHFHFVDMMLNGHYNGTYLLGDKLKISKHRVNVGDDGFLLEIDIRSLEEQDARYFQTKHLEQPVNIKEPEVEYNDANYTYIKNLVETADSILFSPIFTNPREGWQKYMDMDSFVDWFLINEISKNNDACFFSSCYMNLARGGKLKMGPIWDFDISFGNVDFNGNYEVEGFWVKNVAWYQRLFEDPAFVARLKERFDYFYSHQTDIFNFINENANYLKRSVAENNNVWGTLYTYTWPNYDIWGNYLNEVQYMKTWIQRRFEWLKEAFGSM